MAKWMLATALACGFQLAATTGWAQSDPGITQDTIRVGIIGPFSGPAAEYSKAQVGAISYLRSINDQGGIHGRQFELLVEDDSCEEAKGIAAARKLIFDSEVFALASAYACSGPALAAKSVIIESGIPWMIGGAASGELTDPVAKTVFQPTATTPDVGRAMVRFAASKPEAKKIAVISHSNEWAKGYYDGAIEQMKETYGAPPVLDLTMERQSTNATPQILKLREASPDVVIAILYPAEMSVFLREAKKFNLDTTFVTGYGTTVEDQLRRTGDPGAVKNLYAAYLLAAPVDSASMKPWRDMVEKYYPSEDLTTANFQGMGGVLTFVEAVREAGPELTRAKLVEALENIRDFDAFPMAGRFSFTPADHAGQKDLSFAGFVDGKVTTFSAWNKVTE